MAIAEVIDYDFNASSSDISGDYVIIGNKYDDEKGYRAGAAYIYKRSNGKWSQQVKLLAHDAKENDQFGTDVKISGDYAVICSYYYDKEKYSYSYHPYIYQRTVDSWSYNEKLAYYGVSSPVAISGEYIVANDCYKANSNYYYNNIYLYKMAQGSFKTVSNLSFSGSNASCQAQVDISGNHIIFGYPCDNQNRFYI